MRHLTLTILALAACGTDGATSEPDAATSTRGFEIQSPDVTIEPGQEITYCYYFKTPNTEDMVIKKWSSSMTPGSHHMIMFTTTTDSMPPGTISDAECGGFSASNVPSWTYAAQTPENAIALPTDDGTGTPLGQEIPAGTSGYFQMHYLNASDEPLVAHVKLVAEAYEPGAAYTNTAAYVTYNSQISIPPGATNHVESKTCSVPAGSKFWTLSTHAHKQATTTTVKDGMPASTAVAFTSDDWEHPGANSWTTAPFYEFASGKLTYECTYSNTGSNAGGTVVSGPSAATNEMCMATGYYFPATKPLICLNSLGPF